MIRFGLLGCGRIAEASFRAVGRQSYRGSRLVAVCDPISARADAIASKFGVPAITISMSFWPGRISMRWRS